jgi:hypothetical protein
MIPLFGDAPGQPMDSFHADFKTLAVNVAGATARTAKYWIHNRKQANPLETAVF